MKPLEILVVAQTPPPVHGQAMMTQYFLNGRYQSIRLHHVRMAFSESIDEVGVFKWKKIVHLLMLILRIFWMRMMTGAQVLYYPPAGPNRNAFYRDAAILVLTRWMFSKTVFHFFAAGISDLYPQLSWGNRGLYRAAYFKANLGISLYQDGLRDPRFLQCKQSVVVLNGIPDEASAVTAIVSRRDEYPVVLFLAMLSEEKGVLVFLEACAQLMRSGIRIKPVLVGWAESDAFELKIKQKTIECGLEDVLERHDKTVGAAKHDIYRRARVFCFPTFYPSEGGPVVVLEAMQFGIPVVATRWRGIPDEVDDGVTGFLTPVQDPAAVAARIKELLVDNDLHARMSRAAKERAHLNFSLDAYTKRMEDALIHQL